MYGHKSRSSMFKILFKITIIILIFVQFFFFFFWFQGTQASTKTWVAIKTDSCIAGRHLRTIPNIRNILDCKTECERDVRCLSIDYHNPSLSCSLNNADTSSVKTTSPCGGYVFTEPIRGKKNIYTVSLSLFWDGITNREIRFKKVDIQWYSYLKAVGTDLL